MIGSGKITGNHSQAFYKIAVVKIFETSQEKILNFINFLLTQSKTKHHLRCFPKEISDISRVSVFNCTHESSLLLQSFHTFYLSNKTSLNFSEFAFKVARVANIKLGFWVLWTDFLLIWLYLLSNAKSHTNIQTKLETRYFL